MCDKYHPLICILFISSAVSIGFEHSQFTINEDASNLELCLRLHGGELDRHVNLSVNTAGRAQPSVDYSALQDITFYPDDKSRKCLDISITDDHIVEEDESFTLTLTSLDSAISLSPDTVTVLISDNDKVVLAIQQPSYTVQESAEELQLSIEIVDGILDRSVSLAVESRDGNASARTGDYTSLSETLIYTSGSSSGSILTLMVEVGDDQLVEGLESFTIHATAVDTSVELESGRETTTIFIVDNDVCKLI